MGVSLPTTPCPTAAFDHIAVARHWAPNPFAAATASMRIAYACYVAAFAADGVNQKIETQARVWRDAGHDVTLLCLSPQPPTGAEAPALSGRIFTFAGTRSRIGATVALARAAARLEPDVIYLRYDIFLPPVWALMRRHRIVVEINTDDRTEPLSDRLLGRLYHWASRGLILRGASGLVCVTYELGRSPHLARYRKPTAVIANGVETAIAPPAPAPVAPRPAAAMLVGYPSPWAGVDRALELARAMPELDLHLVGPTFVPGTGATPRNVVLHGAMPPHAYRSVLERADFGIGPLALYRKGMNEASPLKVREYLVHGLPVVIAYEDTDYLGENRWFLLRLPNRDDDIAGHVGAIRDWLHLIRGRRVLREEVVDRIGAEAKEASRLTFLGQVASSP